MVLFWGNETTLSLGDTAQCVQAVFPPSPGVTASGAPSCPCRTQLRTQLTEEGVMVQNMTQTFLKYPKY